MPDLADHESSRRRIWKWGVATLGFLAAVSLGTLLIEAHAPESTWSAAFATDETAIPDDTVLLQELEKSIDLRRREDCDRMLDARDAGELIEHATLTEAALDRRILGIDALFVVGDELFGYLFRPENGWGSGGTDGKAIDYTPRLRRVHQGTAGGPDAFGCFSCHSKGGVDGAGTQTQNAFLRGDGERTGGADQRNAPHLLGLGPIACLAREMSAELQAQAAGARERAKAEGHRVEQALTTKGISFGHITADSDGALDYLALEGVDPDLTIRPFGWKGHQA